MFYLDFFFFCFLNFIAGGTKKDLFRKFTSTFRIFPCNICELA